ncbi:Na+/H+ antiporter NhaA [Sphingomonas sp.]|uniref:Na+/H+ antiporter NhaA n=1 Tax=Sphingomonas sp. TaxID=28214 RepID=UPI001B0C2197|nr:Na+/H+ antiporter NhaA [Sphingomonas sp.]MBO9712446.1 Na+/H+ antiporter NhaA [Sphingomonas sp.]
MADFRDKPTSVLRAFFATESAGGFVLIGAAAFALIVANSPLAHGYFALLHVYLGPLSLLHWINDGLMAVFFLLVGLELKRELLDGELSTWDRRALPGAAALAGMVVPAAIYAAVNAGDAGALRGWAIPAATDIAFALGVLALLGPRVPVSLKILLTAIAVIDDLGAILVIAVFYTGELSLLPLAGAAAAIALLAGLARLGVRALWPYLAIGLLAWVAMLLSGVHATIAGVAVAMTVPLTPSPGRPEDRASPLHRLEHGLHPIVAFCIVPLFGFANAGVSFSGLGADALLGTVPLGIAAGLFLGKQVGILGACWAMIRLRLAEMPAGAGWRHLHGLALLAGIGFTMSLFIGALAFGEGGGRADAVKLGVLAGSLLSALAGYAVLRRASRPAARR